MKKIIFLFLISLLGNLSAKTPEKALDEMKTDLSYSLETLINKSLKVENVIYKEEELVYALKLKSNIELSLQRDYPLFPTPKNNKVVLRVLVKTRDKEYKLREFFPGEKVEKIFNKIDGFFKEKIKEVELIEESERIAHLHDLLVR